MNCPKCDGTLAETEIRGTKVDRCPQCRGVWFDEHELETLLELSPAELRPIRGGKMEDSVNRHRASCPRDRTDMTRVRSAMKPNIVVDSCPKCRGIWLDGGELDKLLP
jgi:Zn-finger nucleic acid-binding protein